MLVSQMPNLKITSLQRRGPACFAASLCDPRQATPRRSERAMVVRCSMVIDKPECVTMVDDVSDAQQTPSLSGGWANRVKILLFVASVFLTLSPTSHAAPPGGGFHGGSFRSGFGAHSAGPAFRMGSGIPRDFAFPHGFPFHQNPR